MVCVSENSSSGNCLKYGEYKIDRRYRGAVLMLFVLCVFIVQIACNNEQDYDRTIDVFVNAESIGRGDGNSFKKYLEMVNVIQLSHETTVGAINHLDFDENGRLLVTDQIGSQVLLYDSTGQLLSELSPDPCDPGFNWIPYEARFYPDGSILVTNGGPWGYRFSSKGDCIGPMDNSFIAPQLYDIDKNGNIYGVYKENSYYIKKMNTNGEEIKRSEYESAFANLFGQLGSGGLVCDDEGFVYLALPFSPYIRKYDSEGRFIGKIGWRPHYYEEIEQDIPYLAEPGQIHRAIQQVIQHKSITIDLFLLDKNALLVLYRNGYKAKRELNKEMGIVVISTNGIPLIKEEIQGDRKLWFTAAANGYVYREVLEHTLDSLSVDINPMIEVYKFTR